MASAVQRKGPIFVRVDGLDLRTALSGFESLTDRIRQDIRFVDAWTVTDEIEAIGRTPG